MAAGMDFVVGSYADKSRSMENKPVTDVPASIAALVDQVCEIERAVAVIYDKVADVCKPELPEPSIENGEEDVSRLAPLAETINALARRLRLQVKKMEKLNARLQL